MSGIFQLKAADSVVRINNTNSLNALQSLQWDAQMNAENLEQIGDPYFDSQTINPSSSGSFEARGRGVAASILGRMIYQLDPVTGEFEGYIGAANTTLITENQLQYAQFDLIESQKANEVFDRSTLLPRAFLSSFSLSATADGNASESYSYDGDLLEIYRAPMHDLISIPVTRLAGSLTTAVEVPAPYTVDDEDSSGGDYTIHALDINGIRVPVEELQVTPGSVRGTDPDEVALRAAAINKGISIEQGVKLSLLVYRSTPGSFPAIPAYAADEVRYVKADRINIYLLDPATTFNVGGQVRTVSDHLDAGVNFNEIPFINDTRLLRVQSLEMSVNLQTESLSEIAANDRGTSVFTRAVQFPLDISVSVSSLVTDLSDWQKIQGKGASDVLNLKDFEGQEWMVIRRDLKRDGTPIQTVGVLDCRVDGLGNTVSVGGRSERSWNFIGSKFRLQGA